jgi:carboxypeptidase C (cathepsin A)
MIHYWLIEAETSPSTKPLLYWTNGGPGSSGISVGLLTELGQFQLNENSLNVSGKTELLYNPYSWNQAANILFVSQPKGVGFSYCPDARVSTDCVNDDLTSAQDAYEFFLAFFDAYPEYKANDFYLTGESYAGVYIPLFMQQIDTRGGIPNFKGAAIGNGCWGTAVGLCGPSYKASQIHAHTYFGHGMFEQPLWDTMTVACGNWTAADVARAACTQALSLMSTHIGRFDVYNIYDTCGSDTLTYAEMMQLMSQRSILVENAHEKGPHPQLADALKPQGALNDYACGTSRAASAWLGQATVRQALHVNADTIGMHYNRGPASTSGDLRPLYRQLAQKYRIMIYSGDSDGCVPTWGTEEWVRELNLAVVRGWRAWQSPIRRGATPIRAGYAIDYANGFQYVTIQGSGHMVPTHKPAFAQTMITKFLTRDPF